MNEEKSKELIIPELHEQMLKYRGSQRRTAELYGCTPNWVYMVMHGRGELSEENLERMYDCAMKAISEMKAQADEKNKRKAKLIAKISAKLAAATEA